MYRRSYQVNKFCLKNVVSYIGNLSKALTKFDVSDVINYRSVSLIQTCHKLDKETVLPLNLSPEFVY